MRVILLETSHALWDLWVVHFPFDPLNFRWENNISLTPINNGLLQSKVVIKSNEVIKSVKKNLGQSAIKHICFLTENRAFIRTNPQRVPTVPQASYLGINISQ
jgi:hypothetical protein